MLLIDVNVMKVRKSPLFPSYLGQLDLMECSRGYEKVLESMLIKHHPINIKHGSMK